MEKKVYPAATFCPTFWGLSIWGATETLDSFIHMDMDLISDGEICAADEVGI